MKPRVQKIEVRDHQIVGLHEMGNVIMMWAATTPNGSYTLTLDKVQEPRSIDQNKLMWVWFGVIAQGWSEATGKVFSAQMVHDAYCRMFLPMDMPNGETIGGSTRGLTKEQMTDFLQKVQADAAAEYGITLLSGDDKYFQEWITENKEYLR